MTQSDTELVHETEPRARPARPNTPQGPAPQHRVEASNEPLSVNEDCRLEDDPLKRQEYLSVMVHFYRAEVARSTLWRQRLDATTNWAVLTCAGMLSFAFASPSNTHILLLLSNLMIFSFLLIEARRYRYFEVYRARVRMLEENFLLPIVTRHLDSPRIQWREEVAADLDRPKFKSNLLQAIGFRLRRNYLLVFGVILGAWWVKLGMHPTVADSALEIWRRARVGHFGPTFVAATGLVFYGCLGVLLWIGRSLHGNAPADEISGVSESIAHWKL